MPAKPATGSENPTTRAAAGPTPTAQERSATQRAQNQSMREAAATAAPQLRQAAEHQAETRAAAGPTPTAQERSATQRAQNQSMREAAATAAPQLRQAAERQAETEGNIPKHGMPKPGTKAAERRGNESADPRLMPKPAPSWSGAKSGAQHAHFEAMRENVTRSAPAVRGAGRPVGGGSPAQAGTTRQPTPAR